MKTDRKGRIILQKGDHRVGNFVFHTEENFIKVIATSGIVSWRILRDSAAGQIVGIALKEKMDDWLKTYAAMNFSQLMVVPDHDYFVNHGELVNAQAEKHPEFYGIQAAPENKEEDDKILKEEQELQEALEGNN